MRANVTVGLVFLLIISVPVLHQTVWSQITYLEQGWDDDQRDEFYFTAQGSQLIPYKWFTNLEQVGSQTLFRDNQNIRRYGFLPSEVTARNPDGLPIGFVRDGVSPRNANGNPLGIARRKLERSPFRFSVKQAYLGSEFDEKLYPKERESWFGLTCAACHTHEMKYGSTTLRIDGGSSQADLQSFLRDLGLALEATASDQAKLKRFAKKVRNLNRATGNFKKEVQQIADAVNRLVQRNKAEHPYGFARLDAFGAILNAVCETALGEEQNHRESNAPVSYPSLWNTTKLSYVQWNASADFPEARNVGEVLGVFGTYSLEQGDKQFDSTVRLQNLIKLEHELIDKLNAPEWPEDVFGKLDPCRIRHGEMLFQKNCVSCHPTRDVEGNFKLNQQQRIPVHSSRLPDIKTDSQFLKNLRRSDLVDTGSLSELLGNEAKVPRDIMLQAVVGMIMRNRAKAEQVDLPSYVPKQQEDPMPAGKGAGYISRPLEAVWANAPYFHNGSVPSLYETLLPESKRSNSFWIGNTEFDPVKVGFVTSESETGSRFIASDENGSITGNSNSGHSGHGSNANEGFTQTFENGRWRDFTEMERYALIEYMKWLSPHPKPLPEIPVDLKVEQIPDAEAKQIANIVDLTNKRMRMQYSGDKQVLRGVHPKDHGCVTATFSVRSDLPKELTVGIFQPGKEYKGFVRFSNANVEVAADSSVGDDGSTAHGSRGMAIKLTGVEGDSLLPLHGSLTQDFVMVNQPAFAFANVEDYELLSQVLVDHFGEPNAAAHFFAERKKNGTPEQLKRMARTGQIIQRVRANEPGEPMGAFEKPPASAADNAYFSAAPFLFGKDRVMKFRASPIARSMDEPNVGDPNYLRTALMKRLSKEAIEFDFAVQVRCVCQLDVASDIENASTEWNDDFVSVGKLTIPIQDFDSPQQRLKCERLFFSPWHGIKEFQPLGSINRLRKAVYFASGEHRNLPKEPSSN